MKLRALNEGILRETVTKVIFSTSYSDEVISLDRNQKVFRKSFQDFVNRSVNPYRLENGKKNIEKYKGLFEKISKRYGIPPEVIIAFWALETDFGAVQGNFHILSALGTLASDCRRSEFFQEQYLGAMKLVENEILDAETSTGAWAGEFGQVQMLPLDVIAFGSDGDGDGRVQLDSSPHDTILTAAKSIASKGWQPGQPWLEEVILTKDFPWHESGFGRSRSLTAWKMLGVKLRNNLSFDLSYDKEISLILPQGKKGPKFFAFPNFNIFLEWNNSFMYATAAAYLANQLKGDPKFLSQNPEDILNFDLMIRLQEILNLMGYDVGKVDGILGAKTRQSVRKIQIKYGLPADGWPTHELLKILKII